jgi:hypothetical protein
MVNTRQLMVLLSSLFFGTCMAPPTEEPPPEKFRARHTFNVVHFLSKAPVTKLGLVGLLITDRKIKIPGSIKSGGPFRLRAREYAIILSSRDILFYRFSAKYFLGVMARCEYWQSFPADSREKIFSEIISGGVEKAFVRLILGALSPTARPVMPSVVSQVRTFAEDEIAAFEQQLSELRALWRKLLASEAAGFRQLFALFQQVKPIGWYESSVVTFPCIELLPNMVIALATRAFQKPAPLSSKLELFTAMVDGAESLVFGDNPEGKGLMQPVIAFLIEQARLLRQAILVGGSPGMSEMLETLTSRLAAAKAHCE